MAALTQANVEKVYSDGKSETIALFSVKKVNTNDTLDMSPWLAFVKVAAILGGTRVGAPAVLNVAADGVTVTFNPANIVNDGVWLVCWGVAV